MTHQYRAEDFADLPQKALEALGVCIFLLPSMTGMVTVALSPRLEYEMEGDHAAALLVGLVQQRCDFFLVEPKSADKKGSEGWSAGVALPGWDGAYGSAIYADGPTPLSAVLAAYAAALEGK